MKTGEMIRILREQRNITQEELAKAVGYKTRSSIAKIETGESDPPQKMIKKIADVLEVSPAELVGWSEPEDDQPTASAQIPKTNEARIISGGIDRMPEAKRKRALEMFLLMFAEDADKFNKKGIEDDDT